MIVIYILFILIGISFALLNAVSVKINLYFNTYTLPVSVLMFIMFGAGVIISGLYFSVICYRLKSRIKKMQNQLMLTEKEIKNLRDIPLKDNH